MARKPRQYCESQIYHVILRGNNKQIIYFDDFDRLFFLDRMQKYSKQLGIDIYAYCLMDNHVHILLGKANPHLSLFIQKLATSYAMFFNHKYERSGHLFQGRYKSECVNNEDYFKIVTRYILNNPVKAKIACFQKYRWCSYQETISSDPRKLINRKFLITIFNGIDGFRRFVVAPNHDLCMEYENKYFLSDSHCIKIIRELLDGEISLKSFEKSRNELLLFAQQLIDLGMSKNQICRITGISKSIINAG